MTVGPDSQHGCLASGQRILTVAQNSSCCLSFRKSLSFAVSQVSAWEQAHSKKGHTTTRRLIMSILVDMNERSSARARSGFTNDVRARTDDDEVVALSIA
ncbi:MAG: hypothetical protein ACYC9L_13220 [Sulfuricaulis sp.]